jgi:quercetin dioxygenase-like cupin family protein
MKTKSIVVVFSLALVSFFASAQDPMKVASNVYKEVKVENQQCRVMSIEFKVGESAAMHSHPNHVFIVQAGGKLRITNSDGTSADADLKEGDTLYMDACSHEATNIGNTVIRGMVVEMRHHH